MSLFWPLPPGETVCRTIFDLGGPWSTAPGTLAEVYLISLYIHSYLSSPRAPWGCLLCREGYKIQHPQVATDKTKTWRRKKWSPRVNNCGVLSVQTLKKSDKFFKECPSRAMWPICVVRSYFWPKLGLLLVILPAGLNNETSGTQLLGLLIF